MTTYHPNEDTAENGTTDFSKLRDTVRDEVDTRMAQARESADAAARQVSEVTDKGIKEGTKFVQENPALAVAGALGAGVVLGLLMRGR